MEPVEVRLADGDRVRLRLATPDDRAALLDGLTRLSRRSRHLRFGIDELPPDRVEQLLEVDGLDHVAVAAFDTDGGGLGVARYLRETEGDSVAELSLAVIDDWQGRGVGGALLHAIAQVALANGVEVFRSYVLPENDHAITLLDALGATRHVTEAGVHVVDVPVSDASERVRDGLAGRALRAARDDALRVGLPATPADDLQRVLVGAGRRRRRLRRDGS